MLAIDRIQAKFLATKAADAKGTEAAVESVIVPALEQIGNGWHAGDWSPQNAEDSLTHIFKRADTALYQAKNQSRNRVVAVA